MRQPRSCRSTSSDVEGVHRLAGRAPHLAVQAEHRHAVDRIVEVGQLHHIVLLVAAQPVLRPERRGDVHARRDQRVEAVRQVRRHRRRMREQRDAAALQLAEQLGVGEQAVDTEIHGLSECREFERKAIGMMEIGRPGRVAQRPVGFGAVGLLDDGGQADAPVGRPAGRQIDSIRQSDRHRAITRRFRDRRRAIAASRMPAR